MYGLFFRESPLVVFVFLDKCVIQVSANSHFTAYGRNASLVIANIRVKTQEFVCIYFREGPAAIHPACFCGFYAGSLAFFDILVLTIRDVGQEQNHHIVYEFSHRSIPAGERHVEYLNVYTFVFGQQFPLLHVLSIVSAETVKGRHNYSVSRTEQGKELFVFRSFVVPTCGKVYENILVLYTERFHFCDLSFRILVGGRNTDIRKFIRWHGFTPNRTIIALLPLGCQSIAE
nr:MAG TPA: hypothetical protein [Caudoviricetes sp.]